MAEQTTPEFFQRIPKNVWEKQQYYQHAAKFTHMKGPHDKYVSFIIPSVLVATAGVLMVRTDFFNWLCKQSMNLWKLFYLLFFVWLVTLDTVVIVCKSYVNVYFVCNSKWPKIFCMNHLIDQIFFRYETCSFNEKNWCKNLYIILKCSGNI